MRTKTSTLPPEGFRYQPEILPPEEEQELVERHWELALKEFEFHGYTGKRRVLSFGWQYDFEERILRQTGEIPSFVHKLRERAGT